MALDIHYHSKREERKHRKYGTKSRQKKLGKTLNFGSPCLLFKCSSNLQLISTLLTAIHFSLLDWFHTLLAALLHRYSIALVSPSPCGFQDNPGFSVYGFMLRCLIHVELNFVRCDKYGSICSHLCVAVPLISSIW